MIQRRQSKAGVILVEETREQAARAISRALDFLRHEADAIGMSDVSELIGRARKRADEDWPRSKTEEKRGKSAASCIGRPAERGPSSLNRSS